jgi:hypothetical protein
VEQGWREKLQRMEYEADLARLRYEMVDPENRLVAQTLGTEWNQCLEALEKAKRVYEAQRPTAYELRSTLEQMKQVVNGLREHWYTEEITIQDKKELLRCLVERVFLESRGKIIHAEVVWHGGEISELNVPKYLFTAPRIYHRICDLARTHTDAEIAEILNQEGTKTVKGKLWTSKRVMDFRLSNAIPSGFTTNTELRIPESGYITSAEAAEQLDVHQTTIQKWYRWGILSGKQDGRQSPLWIRWTEDVVYQLNGGATPDPRMVSVRSLCQSQSKRPAQVFSWARDNGHTIYRLRRGSAMRFYILPNESSVPPE